MKRCVVRVMVCVVVGVVVNVLVSWGCVSGHVAIATVLRVPGAGTLPVDQSWPVMVPEDWPSGWRSFLRVTSFGVRYSVLSASREPVTYSVTELAAGWPVLAVSSYEWEANVFVTGRYGRFTPLRVHPPTWHWGVEVSHLMGAKLRGSWKTELWLPLRPVWPGYVINVAVYGVAAWVVVFGPGVMNRAWRRKRGLCAACGYEVAGIVGVCPECGVEKKMEGKAEPSPVTQSGNIVSHAQSSAGEGALTDASRQASTLPGGE